MEEDAQIKVTELINKAEITSVVNSYFRALDEKHFDNKHFATFLATDAEVTRPNGLTLAGPEAISASHAESLSHYESTQHILTGHDIAINGDVAKVRANLGLCTCTRTVSRTLTKPIISLLLAALSLLS